ncbi:hypothetical protein [Streptacidiphilus monticola]|uniref:Uncharacterized protein n=1 Tax=Streptacidiphilus monticola TaxID=2161674 RepID=A0ABW1GCK9_9ACTN
MNAGDIAVILLSAPAVLAAGPLAVRMAKEKRESEAVLRMLARERWLREQGGIEFVPSPPPGSSHPGPSEQTPAKVAGPERLAPVIELRRAA